MSFAFIDRQKAAFPISSMCRVLGVSQSGFFACRGRPASQRQRDDMVDLAHIRAAFKRSNGTYGSARCRYVRTWQANAERLHRELQRPPLG